LILLSGLTDLLVIFSLDFFYYLLPRTSWEKKQDTREKINAVVVAVPWWLWGLWSTANYKQDGQRPTAATNSISFLSHSRPRRLRNRETGARKI
jgi:hypothetical protein